jgi:hypothetical protein
MLHITLAAARTIDPTTDELGRDRVGYANTMSELALYDANHGCWVLGERAQRERYALFTFDGIVRQAVEIERIEPVTSPKGSGRERRSVIHGTILRPGHEAYDTYVNKPTPAPPVRNPITYIHTPTPGHPCRCGCGKTVTGKDFLTGHDQTALHDRVRQIGTVAEFLEWFDIVRGTRRSSDAAPACNNCGAPAGQSCEPYCSTQLRPSTPEAANRDHQRGPQR